MAHNSAVDPTPSPTPSPSSPSTPAPTPRIPLSPAPSSGEHSPSVRSPVATLFNWDFRFQNSSSWSCGNAACAVTFLIDELYCFAVLKYVWLSNILLAMPAIAYTTKQEASAIPPWPLMENATPSTTSEYVGWSESFLIKYIIYL